MPCLTCDHTMILLDESENGTHWCPRCGTLRSTSPGGFDDDQSPKLVDRCRKYREEIKASVSFYDMQAYLKLYWDRLGISEAISKPEDR